MKREDIQFQIDQLRKDKIIYAIESAATSLIALFIFGALQFIVYSLPMIQNYINQLVFGIIIIPTVFWLYVVVGNLMRLKKIKKLEKMLKEESEEKPIRVYRRKKSARRK